MRRTLVLGGIWALGVAVSVTLAFAAVGRVASGVAPHDPARLSKTAIDDALAAASAPPQAATGSPTPSTTTGPPPAGGSTTPTTAAGPNTATTSQGGTLLTRCSGPDTIVYVAAVPRTGYERLVDDEDRSSIRQSFENANHRSTIEASCRNGTVIAHVEEKDGPTDDATGG